MNVYEDVCLDRSRGTAVPDLGAYGSPDACNWLDVVPQVAPVVWMCLLDGEPTINWTSIPRNTYLNSPRRREDLRGIYGLLAAWDLMRMRHEGGPPYSVRFAPGFAESLREAVEDEGGEKPPDAEVEAMLQQLSGPREYRMAPRDFAMARFGVIRARKTGVIPESVAAIWSYN